MTRYSPRESALLAALDRLRADGKRTAALDVAMHLGLPVPTVSAVLVRLARYGDVREVADGWERGRTA